MKRLHLIRHGETAWNAEKRLQGNHDVELSPTGMEQARALAPVVGAAVGRGGVHVVTSPLSRAAATCELLGFTPHSTDADWAEADLGEWTGRTHTELIAEGTGEYAAWRAGTFMPPGSESLGSIRGRVRSAIDRLTGAEVDDVVVVTHGGPIRAACWELLGLDTGSLVPVLPGSLTVVDTSGPRPRLRHFNLTPQLCSPANPAPDLAVADLAAEPTD